MPSASAGGEVTAVLASQMLLVSVRRAFDRDAEIQHGIDVNGTTAAGPALVLTGRREGVLLVT